MAGHGRPVGGGEVESGLAVCDGGDAFASAVSTWSRGWHRSIGSGPGRQMGRPRFRSSRTGHTATRQLPVILLYPQTLIRPNRRSAADSVRRSLRRASWSSRSGRGQQHGTTSAHGVDSRPGVPSAAANALAWSTGRRSSAGRSSVRSIHGAARPPRTVANLLRQVRGTFTVISQTLEPRVQQAWASCRSRRERSRHRDESGGESPRLVRSFVRSPICMHLDIRRRRSH